MIDIVMLSKKGDDSMKADRAQLRLSSVGVGQCVMSAAATGLIVTALTNNSAGIVVGGLAGLYFLFSIRVADQWEKVVVPRFGRYIGLRGPGLFHMIPPATRSAGTWTRGCG